jgi:bifunctional DNase/RNase
VNALRTSPLLRPVLTLLAACVGLLLIPAIASVGAERGPLPSIPRLPVAAAALCEGKTCADLVEMEVRDVVPLESESHAVVLVTKDKGTVLPIFVDEGSAVAIAFKLAHRASPHPQATDMMDSMLTQLGGELTEVRIDKVEDAVFTGQMLVTQGDKHLQIPARPSDSIALALGHGVKIFASRQVLTRAGISQADIDRLRKSLPRGHPPADDREKGTGGSGLEGDETGGDDGHALPTGKRNDPIRL